MDKVIKRNAVDGKMDNETRVNTIEMLKRVIEKLENGKDKDVMFAFIGTHREDVDSAEGIMWGPSRPLLEMLSGLNKPIVEQVIGRSAEDLVRGKGFTMAPNSKTIN